MKLPHDLDIVSLSLVTNDRKKQLFTSPGMVVVTVLGNRTARKMRCRWKIEVTFEGVHCVVTRVVKNKKTLNFLQDIFVGI